MKKIIFLVIVLILSLTYTYFEVELKQRKQAVQKKDFFFKVSDQSKLKNLIINKNEFFADSGKWYLKKSVKSINQAASFNKDDEYFMNKLIHHLFSLKVLDKMKLTAPLSRAIQQQKSIFQFQVDINRNRHFHIYPPSDVTGHFWIKTVHSFYLLENQASFEGIYQSESQLPLLKTQEFLKLLDYFAKK